MDAEIGAKDNAQNKNSFSGLLAIVLTLGAISWELDLYRRGGLLLYTEQVLSGVLALALPLVFISLRVRKGISGVPWYDWTAAAASFAAAAYMAVRYPILAEMISDTPWDGLVSGAVVMVLMTEAVRRTVGPIMTALVIIFLVLALVGHLLPGELSGRPIEFKSLIYYLSWDPTGILGTPLSVVTTIVIAFVFFGQVLLKSGGSAFFTEASIVLVGRYRGGQAKIAITASAFFGSISGSAVSNVVTTGVVTIPMMRNAGYRGVHAGAIEAVASTGGQLMPPIMGAAAFIMAEFLEISYAEVVIAATIPAILYYAALFIAADLEAARSGIAAVAKEDIPPLAPILRSGWHFPLPFAVLVLALFWWNWSPQEAALLATAVMFVTGMTLGYKGVRLAIGDVIDAIRDTGFAVLDIIMVGAAAGVVIGVIGVTGIGFGLTLKLVEIGGSNLPLLMLISAFVCILLGMGMPTVGVYLVLAPLVGPSLIEVGINPIAAHLFILYFGMMSMITPPVAIAAYAAASLTGEDAMATGFWAMRFGWFAYLVPFLFLIAPELLMQGEWFKIIYVSIMSFIGIWYVSIGFAGHFGRPIGVVARILVVAAGIAVLVPANAFEFSLLIDLAGLAIGAAIIGREWLAIRGS
ncbi:MAG: TRAP transporter fused permease subunit [Rhodospirillales bacterium]|nr:TRAP transporter fused permease subunit [Rhodospirillales bacterium]